MTLSDDELHRYARQIVLPQFGGARQALLKAAKVVVVGAGGIGSSVIPALAGAGVGRLTIIDGDTVDPSNLHRQTIFRDDEAGRSKAELTAAYIRALNPFVEAAAVSERINSGNAGDLLGGHDLVIDGTDNFATRLMVSDSCVQLGLPLLSAAATQFQAQIALFEGRPCYRCFVGDAFDSDDCDNCAELGVLGPVTGIAGQFAALMALRQLGKVAGDSGKLHVFDGVALRWRTISLPADPDCRACR